jgi:FkbM family methyltransferase
VADGVELKYWLNFSEYWTYRKTTRQAQFAFARKMFTRQDAGSTAIDVGSNIGVFSCVLASLGAGAVHCFEPVPETFCRLRKNVLANGMADRCTLNCLAVGSESGTTQLTVSQNSPATNRIKGGTESAQIGSNFGVGVTTLDEYCSCKQIANVQFLKIDVEGAEPLVLRGARRLLLGKKVNSVLLEVCPANLNALGFRAQDLWNEIQSVNYVAHQLAENGSTGPAMTPADFFAVTLNDVALLPAR